MPPRHLVGSRRKQTRTREDEKDCTCQCNVWLRKEAGIKDADAPLTTLPVPVELESNSSCNWFQIIGKWRFRAVPMNYTTHPFKNSVYVTDCIEHSVVSKSRSNHLNVAAINNARESNNRIVLGSSVGLKQAPQYTGPGKDGFCNGCTTSDRAETMAITVTRGISASRRA